MMSKYEMPLAQPVMTATSHQATVFCILAQHDQCIPWLINNYISIFCLEKLYALPINRRGTLDFFWSLYSDWSLFEFSANPWLQYDHLPYSSFGNCTSKEMITFLKSLILNGKYLYIDVDWFFIKLYNSYHKTHKIHNLLLTGFDESSKIFYAYDTAQTGKFVKAFVSYNELFEGIHSSMSSELFGAYSERAGIMALKVALREWHQMHTQLYLVNTSLIKHHLEEYILGKAQGYSSENVHGFRFGIECYRELTDFVEAARCGKVEEIDHRAFTNMHDHKKMMVFRLKEMEKSLQIDLSGFIADWLLISNDVRIAVNKILKWNMFKDDCLLAEIKSILILLSRKEKESVDKLLQIL